MHTKDLHHRREQLIGKATLFYSEPIQLVRGEGVYLFDEAGRRYTDMYNNVPVSAMQTLMWSRPSPTRWHS